MEELILRIIAILKRSLRQTELNKKNEFRIGNSIFNFDKRFLSINRKEKKLTSKEADLLKLLCENRNNILERSTALMRLWKNENYFTSRSMDVYITRLRNYLKNDPQIKIINIHGTGFKLITE